MDTKLKDKVVIVTGGASGIGEAAVRGFIDEGAITVFIDKNKDKGQRLSDEFLINSRTLNTPHRFIYGDLTNEDFCKQAIEKTIKDYGRLDVLVNNAGKNDWCDIDDTTPVQFRESLERNFIHYYTMSHFSWPYLKETRGNIVFVGSKVALVGEGHTTAYASAKGACIGLTRELAAKSAKENLGIRVNCVIPAIVNTPLQNLKEKYGSTEQGLKEIGRPVPFERRPTESVEIANEIIFLASNHLSAHTTGQLRFPDGGYLHIDRDITH